MNDLIMLNALIRQCFLDEDTPSVVSDDVGEEPGDEVTTECSVGVIGEFIVLVAICRNVLFFY